MSTQLPGSPGSGPLIAGRIHLPSVDAAVPERPRITELIHALLRKHARVSISAMPGAGKTTAAVHAAQRWKGPVAWLAVDTKDADPWRLLSYLEASISLQVAGVTGVCESARAANLSARETAGVLAEAVADHQLLLILDDLEKIRDVEPARTVLGGLVRFAPNTVRFLLLSRRDAILDLRERLDPGHTAEISDSHLALTGAEAVQAFSGLGVTLVDPQHAIDGFGGWVTGVMFEAWASFQHTPSIGGTDPLNSYLRNEIMDSLNPDDAHFLIATSLVNSVTAERAYELGQPDAAANMASLRVRRLPVQWSDGGATMQVRPRFRQFLLERLSTDSDEIHLRRRYADLLLKEDRREEAVQEFIKARALDNAARSAREGIGGVIDELHFDVADRWIELLHTVDEPNAALSVAEFMVAMGREQYRRAAEIGDELGLLAENPPSHPGLVDLAPFEGMLAWAYWHTGRIDDARRLLDRRGDNRSTEIAQGMVGLSAEDAADLPEILLPSGGPLEGLLMRIYYYRGFLKPLIAAAPVSPWGRAMGASVRVGALRATGRIDQALELCEAIRTEEPGLIWLRVTVSVELMIDLDRRDEAWQQLAEGRELIAGLGSQPYTLLSQVLEAKMHLRFNRDVTAALDVLRGIENHTHNYRFIKELADTWVGYALLLSREHERARQVLSDTVDSMVRGDRLLELSTAAVYLSQAEWLCGNEDGADRAADVALKASERHGSNHTLMQAIDDYPDVVSRRLDAEPQPWSRWHDLARSYSAHSKVRAISHRSQGITLKDLGQSGLLVDGLRKKPRIIKSIELLAFLQSQPAARATREQVLNALFGGRADRSARSYLRQALYQLREVLPDALAPRTELDYIVLPRPEDVVSDARSVQALLDQGARLHGEAKLDTIMSALDLARAGPYLAESDSPWVEERRQKLADEVSAARLGAATVAFDLGRLSEADTLVEIVVHEDQYREEGWRLAILLADAFGDSHKLVQRYVTYERSLEQIGMTPTNDIAALFQRLRDK